ncbi:hypothetical protein ACJ73_06688 [Blastomyces percursus]|uniref:Uncharacterized protein n=1 Tax=Blastomyces percursus TaxID=1658174 RepID=A0A1J9Q070_9EURO|nr:hypothetical protein ACJ73_06688 [Blastomyces percursus]
MLCIRNAPSPTYPCSRASSRSTNPSPILARASAYGLKAMTAHQPAFLAFAAGSLSPRMTLRTVLRIPSAPTTVSHSYVREMKRDRPALVRALNPLQPLGRMQPLPPTVISHLIDHAIPPVALGKHQADPALRDYAGPLQALARRGADEVQRRKPVARHVHGGGGFSESGVGLEDVDVYMGVFEQGMQEGGAGHAAAYYGDADWGGGHGVM